MTVCFVLTSFGERGDVTSCVTNYYIFNHMSFVLLLIQPMKCIYASLHNHVPDITQAARSDVVRVFIDCNKSSFQYSNATSYMVAAVTGSTLHRSLLENGIGT